ncbi:hypothetical protein D9756_008563 [Leucocoprinus leucothites]|uniref:Uncharacterized protein n=1 Tax=Leucocoprinus leucothites TaxID=201217 RepID=A0A8H5D219_9AGAR|nr:hypothetical protein D9756_008563 [Leucoagaricus leucothites]
MPLNLFRKLCVRSSKSLISTAHPFPSLPAELWYLIASFIPFSEFCAAKLYTLNHSLFSFYLEEKYRKLTLEYVYDNDFMNDRLSKKIGQYQVNLKILSDAVIDLMPSCNRKSPVVPMATRILKLQIRPPNCYFCSSPSSTERVKRRLQARLSQVVEILGPLRPRDATRRALAFREYTVASLSRLNNLTSMKLDWSPPDRSDYQPSSPVNISLLAGLAAAWISSKNTLVNLSLVFRAAYLLDTALPTVELTSLRKFELTISPQYDLFDEEPPLLDDSLTSSRELLIRFLSNHQSTLQTLHLMLPSSRFAEGVLDKIPFLSSLTSLSLSFTLYKNTLVLSSLPRFLQRQSAQLQEFTFRLYTKLDPALLGSWYNPVPANLEWWISQPFVQVDFPQLDKLTLRLDTPFLFSYAAKFATRIRTLSIAYNETSQVETREPARTYLLYSEIRDLLGVLTRTTVPNSLQELAICTKKFTPGLLRLLGHSLPELRTLRIQCRTFDTVDDYNPNLEYDESPLPYTEFSTVVFPDWKLNHIFLSQQYPFQIGAWKAEKEEFCAALLHALPNVKYFNGVTRGEDWMGHW